MAIDIDSLCVSLSLPISAIGNNPNVTKRIVANKAQFEALAKAAAADIETGKPNAGKLGGDVEIIYIRDGG